MAEEDKKEVGAESASSDEEKDQPKEPAAPAKKVRPSDPHTPGGAASEDDEGQVTVADLDTAVRVPGGGVRTDPKMAKKYKLEEELGQPSAVTQKHRKAKAAAEGEEAKGEESSDEEKATADGDETDAASSKKKAGRGTDDGDGEDQEPRPPWYEPVTRRSWLGGAWAAFAATLGIGTLATVRFMYPNVLFEPPLKFKVGYPKDFQLGVSNLYKDRYGVWIVREEDGFYALRAVCTHLGCTPNWLEADQKFKCPCHGSGFYITGVNFEGPAPRPLERVGISIADDGQILVNKGLTFQQEKGQWDDPRSILLYTA